MPLSDGKRKRVNLGKGLGGEEGGETAVGVQYREKSQFFKMYSFPSWKSTGQMSICHLLAFMCFLLHSMQLDHADCQVDWGEARHFPPMLYITGGEPQDRMHISKCSTTENPSSLFRDSLSSSGWSLTYSVAQADFSLKSFLPHPTEYLSPDPTYWINTQTMYLRISTINY